MAENLSALELTRALVRFDTINPPRNARPCAQPLRRTLADAGFAGTYPEERAAKRLRKTRRDSCVTQHVRRTHR